MGIYSAKIALESAVKPEDVINTPDNIGAELDEIEKAIAGPDGIEASREEVEDAQTGLIGDPIEEAFMVMYESEYNYNQIMHTIGIHELAAASMGRDFVLEAADRDGFFKRVSDWLKDMFAKIAKAFKYAVAKISSLITNDKKFVEKHKDAIIGGAQGDWSAKGFVFKDTIAFDKDVFKATDWAAPAADKIKGIKTENNNVALDEFDVIKSQILGKVAKDVNDLEGMRKALYAELRNGNTEPIELNGKISGNDVIAILSGENEKKAIVKAYDEVKNSYKESHKAVDKLRKEIKDNEKDFMANGLSKAFAICEYYTRAIKFEKQVQTVVYTTLIKAASEKRAQARKLAAHFISAYQKPKAEKLEAKNESADLFGGIKLI